LPLLDRLVAFSEILRDAQFGVTPAETLDASEAIATIDIANVEDFRLALKTALVKKSEYYDRFDELFKKFWLVRSGATENPLGRISIPGKKIERTLRIPAPNSNQTGRGRITAGSMFSSQSQSANDAEKMLGIYSPLETMSRKSFNDLKLAEDRAILKRGLRSLAKATATRPGRRSTLSKNGRELDFRNTLRENLKTGGHSLQLELRRRKLSKSRIVVLCDISGSMDSYSNRVLKVIYHLSNTIRGSQVFGFSTSVISLNRYMQGKSLSEASRLVSERVDIWSSGTRIGSALGDMLSNHSGVLRSTSVFIIISDGWELGDIAKLRARLNEIQRKVALVIWLNPQADSPDYFPLAEGMKSSLPYIDIFAGLDILSNRNKFRRVFGPNNSVI